MKDRRNKPRINLRADDEAVRAMMLRYFNNVIRRDLWVRSEDKPC